MVVGDRACHPMMRLADCRLMSTQLTDGKLTHSLNISRQGLWVLGSGAKPAGRAPVMSLRRTEVKSSPVGRRDEDRRWIDGGR